MFSPMRRFFITLNLVAVGLLAAVPAAHAADGMGLVGRTNDKMITFFCFGVMIFFTVFVTVMTWIQHTREVRKERRQADAAKLNDE